MRRLYFRYTARQNLYNMQDAITSSALAAALAGTIFADAAHIHCFPKLESTNTAATQAATSGAPEGTIYSADQQTSGRGRGGHSWDSQPGTGIYISIVLRPQIPASEIQWLSLIAGLAVYDAVQAVTSIAPDLRWPNDIMLPDGRGGDKKLGGILTELSTDTGRATVKNAVVGIGLNINHTDFPADIRSLATSLFLETGRHWPRADIAAALLKSLDREYRAWCAGTGAARAVILQRFEQCSSYARGANVVVDDHGSGEFTGNTDGLDARGFLLVDTPTGRKTVISGGVRKMKIK